MRYSNEVLVAAVLEQGSIPRAAKQLGISRDTLYTRAKTEEFARMLQEAQTAVLTAAVGRLSGSVATAVEVLIDVLNDEEAKIPSKIAAADAILRHCWRYVEMTSILQRLDRLEQSQINNKEAE